MTKPTTNQDPASYVKSGPHPSERGPLYLMVRPSGYSIAGSGWSRYYATQRAAERAHTRLTNRGYEASVISHPQNPAALRFAVLVSRYKR